MTPYRFALVQIREFADFQDRLSNSLTGEVMMCVMFPFVLRRRFCLLSLHSIFSEYFYSLFYK